MAVPSPFPPPADERTVAMASSAEAKAALRREARQRRRAFAAARGVWTPARAIDGLSGRACASYRPVGSEADPAAIERAVPGPADLCYPRLDADGTMRFYAPGEFGWLTGAHGIAVPAEGAREVRPEVVLLPLLAFDRSGTRLGQGGGHYDRALAALAGSGAAPLRIGIAWSVQEMPDLPREGFDIPLDAVLTEREWIACAR